MGRKSGLSKEARHPGTNALLGTCELLLLTQVQVMGGQKGKSSHPLPSPGGSCHQTSGQQAWQSFVKARNPPSWAAHIVGKTDFPQESKFESGLVF